MTDKVVDASALAAVCFDEPDSLPVAQALNGVNLIAPSLIEFEMTNICWKKARRTPELALVYRRQLVSRSSFDIDLRSISTDEVAELAIATGLSAYDASYLWLARKLGVALVTLDVKLARAAAMA